MIARKVMLLGEIGVGKSSIVQRLVFDRFDLNYKPTIGVDVYRYEVPETATRQRMALIVWDTDGNFGESIFRHIYMREAAAAVIVGDVSRPRTLETLAALADGFREALPGRALSLVINKLDLVAQGEEIILPDALTRRASSSTAPAPRPATTSATPSQKPQMPSTGDASDRDGPRGPAPLLTAVRQLADRDVYGLVWIGPDLVVDSKYGRMVEFVHIAEPITSSIYALVGMEDEIAALRDRPGAAIELPDVTLVTPEGRRPRATLSISWSIDDRAYILLVARTETRSDLETELTAQMRARLMAESELAAKTHALERANADLEAYASIISHDLQSPLRVLRYTLDDLDAAVPADPVTAMKKICKLRDLSFRLTQMMSALLDYASITRKTDAIERVDTARLVRAVASSIDTPAGMTVAIAGTWPTAATVPALLDLVLRNLVDNAIKHHDRAIGEITVGCAAEDRALVITVADDGPGIGPADQEAAFLPFRKLNSSTAGEGMGLALVRRTVEIVGGKITLASAAPGGRGTTFTVRWPIR